MTSLTFVAAGRGSAVRSQRAVVFATIAGLHVAAIALIVSGFGRVVMQKVIDPLVGIDIPIERPVDPPAIPPPSPELTQAVVDPGPRPDIPIEIEGGGETAITAPFVDTPPQVPVLVAPPAAPPIRVIGKHRLPNTDEYYPPAEIRGNVEGASIVSVCVDANGRRSNEPSVVLSSGSANLDNAATRVARDGRYARALQGDQYVPNCYQFRIVFKINQR